MRKQFSDKAWEDYLWLQANDRAALKKANSLIKSIERDGALGGEGKPERLSGDLSGWLSRRITREHRLVYRVVDGTVQIAACRTHYGDR